MQVIKKDGKTEEFVKEKITVSLVKNGLDADTARKIADSTEAKFIGKDSIASSEIRAEVLNALQSNNMSQYNKWLEYEKSKI
jgi:transcriptional regulator NrdR family protein